MRLELSPLLVKWILNRTLMGRAIFATGGSLAVAERLGYDVRAVPLGTHNMVHQD